MSDIWNKCLNFAFYDTQTSSHKSTCIRCVRRGLAQETISNSQTITKRTQAIKTLLPIDHIFVFFK